MNTAELIMKHIDSRVQPLERDIKEMKSDIKELKEFKWKISGLVTIAGSLTGLLGFVISKLLEYYFKV